MNNNDIYIIIPAKDEATRIGKVLHKIKKEGYNNVIVINDGSRDTTAHVAESFGATVLTHMVNLGPGAATQTGLEYAMRKGAKVVVTLDADDQHCPSDIKHLIAEMEKEKVDVVIGSRFLKLDNEVPRVRIILNKVGNYITAFFTGLLVTDSQSGFKAMSIDFVKKSKISLSGFEFCTEIISMIKKEKVTYSEVPIKVSYTKESMEKGQSFGNGFKMVGTFIRHFL